MGLVWLSVIHLFLHIFVEENFQSICIGCSSLQKHFTRVYTSFFTYRYLHFLKSFLQVFFFAELFANTLQISSLASVCVSLRSNFLQPSGNVVFLSAPHPLALSCCLVLSQQVFSVCVGILHRAGH